MTRPKKRDELIDAAIKLFKRDGYRATGVDRLMEETGIAKTTLYRHFATKDELIVAALVRIDEQAREDMRAFVEAASDDPKKRILAAFDWLEPWLEHQEFRGCPFVAAAAEFGNPTDPIFQQVLLHKRLTLAYFEELVWAARIPHPKSVARQLIMLHEGAIAIAHVLGAERVVTEARAAARSLIEHPADALLQKTHA